MALAEGKIDLKKGQKAGPDGFEKVASASTAASPATVAVVSDDKKKFDIATGKTHCPKCGADVPGEDICPECGFDRSKELSPAYTVYSIAHVRGGGDLSMSTDVLLVNHEIGHSDVCPVNTLYKGGFEAVTVKKFEDRWKSLGKQPYPWWPSDIHLILNHLDDQLVNFVKMRSSPVEAWFGDAFAAEMLGFYVADKDHPELADDFGDELTSISNIHFRLNRAFALSKFGMEKEREKVLSVKDPEEQAKLRELFEWFYKTIERADDAVSGPNMERFVEMWAWFICERGINLAGRLVSFGIEYPTTSFRDDMKKKKYTDAKIDDIVKKTQTLFTWVNDQEAKQIESEIDEIADALAQAAAQASQGVM